MSVRRTVRVACSLGLALLASCQQGTNQTAPAGGGGAHGDAVVVASFNFPESELLAAIYGLAIRHAGIPVQLHVGVDPEHGPGRTADDPGHEVAFEHHRRSGTSGEGLLGRRTAFGQPGIEEGRDAVASRCIAHRHTGLAGERAQHQFEIPLLNARPDRRDLELLPAQAGAGGPGRAG